GVSRPVTPDIEPRKGPLSGPATPGPESGFLVLRAGGAVDRERGGCGVAVGPGALEAHGGVAACRDGGVVGLVGDGDVFAGLGGDAVPGVGDLGVAGEGDGECPVVDGRRAGVVDRDVGHDAALPFAGLGVGDVAEPAAGGADGPGEGRGAGCAGGVLDGDGDRGGPGRGRGAGDQAGGGADRQAGGQVRGAVAERLPGGGVGRLDLQADRGADGTGLVT